MFIVTNAQSPDSFYNIGLGVTVARRGWLEKKDVINSKTLTQLRKELS